MVGEGSAGPSARAHRLITLSAAAAAVVLGVSVMVGWLARVRWVLRLHPDWAPMQFNTALGFVLSGLAIAAMATGRRRVAIAAAGIVGTLALITVVEYLVGANFGIDELFVRDFVQTQTSHPGRMAPNTAVSFLVTAFAVLLGTVSPATRRSYGVGALGSVVGTLGIVVLAGYALGLSTAYGWGSLTRMAGHAAFGFCAVGVALYTAARVSSPGQLRWTRMVPTMAVVVAVIVLWHVLTSGEAKFIRTVARLQGEAWVSRVGTEIEQQVRSLERATARWEYRRPSLAEWEIDAEAIVAHNPLYQAIEWVDSEGHVQWVVPLVENRAAIGFDLTTEARRRGAFDRSRAERKVAVSRPIDLASGGKGFITTVPLLRDGVFDGVIVGVFRFSTLTEKLLPGGPVELRAVRIEAAGENVFEDETVGVSSHYHEGLELFVRDQRWVIELVSTDGSVGGSLGGSLAPWLVLLLGLAAAGLTSALVSRSYAVRERARELGRANVSLEEKTLELRKANRRGIERQRQLEAVNRELNSFTYSVSHDLRAPLRAVDGFARILLEENEADLDAEGKRVLGIIMANVAKMGDLIDDLLAFSRLGRQPLDTTSVDMGALARDALEEVLASSKGRVVDCQIGDLPGVVGDKALLRQVWINLISNAVKYTAPRESARITVTGKTLDGEVVCAVEDNGVGFDMKYASKLFGVFQRLHKATEFEGTGVGLALVNRIVARHGGRVWADAKIDNGATFSFALLDRSDSDGSNQ